MRTALLALLLTACTNNPSKLDNAPAGTAPVGGGGGIGSGSAALDEVFNEMRDYTMAMVPVFGVWNGNNCDAVVEKLLTLEPLAQKIRANIENVDEAALRARMMPHRDEVQKAIADLLAKTGKTMKDLEDSENQIKTKCGADQKFRDAMEKVGVFKKRAQMPPSHQGFVPPTNPTPAPPVPAPAAP